MNSDLITVMTVSRGRPAWLLRCIASVQAQQGVETRHIVLIDDCDESDAALRREAADIEGLTWFLRRRRPGEQSGPSHLAQLRNLLIRMTQSRWVAFLDDDNTFLPNHLSQLRDLAVETGCPAVHSWLRLVEPSGEPHTRARWPWCRDEAEGEARYAQMAAKGVVTPGDNIVRDSLGNYPLRCVDTSAWLFERKMLGDAPMDPTFSYEEFVTNKAEDDKLHAYIMANQVPVASSQSPTLIYTLGGYSTNHDGSSARAEVWKWTADA